MKNGLGGKYRREVKMRGEERGREWKRQRDISLSVRRERERGRRWARDSRSHGPVLTPVVRKQDCPLCRSPWQPGRGEDERERGRQR